VIDRAGASVAYIVDVARKLHQEHDLRVVGIDYLGLVTTPRFQAREREVAFASRAFKELARELAIPVLLIVQLNRNIEVRSERVPILSDLRESGSIEADSDIVLLLAKETDEALGVYVAKHRNGPTGKVALTCQGALFRLGDCGWRAPR
jgi:replicative DNA helicase